MKKKVVCVLPTLGHGGAQKVLLDIANHLDKKCDFEVSFIVFGEMQGAFYDAGDIPVEYMGLLGGDSGFKELFILPFKLWGLLRAKKPSVVLVFMDIANFPTILASLFLRDTKVIVSERQDTKYYRFCFARVCLRYILYRFSWRVVTQTDYIHNQMPGYLRSTACVIPNPISCFPRHSNFVHLKDRKRIILLVGRLVEQKGYSDFLDAIANVSCVDLGWEVHIYGEGLLRENLANKILDLKLQHYVFLKGSTPDVFSKMMDAQIFVLPSVYEGFPNSLAEAAAAGLPLVAYHGVSGVEALVIDGFNGFVVKEKRDSGAMAVAISDLMRQQELRQLMSQNSMVVAQRFDSYKIYEKWRILVASGL